MVTKTVDDPSDGNHWPNITTRTRTHYISRTPSLIPKSYLGCREVQSIGEKAQLLDAMPIGLGGNQALERSRLLVEVVNSAVASSIDKMDGPLVGIG